MWRCNLVAWWLVHLGQGRVDITLVSTCSTYEVFFIGFSDRSGTLDLLIIDFMPLGNYVFSVTCNAWVLFTWQCLVLWVSSERKIRVSQGLTIWYPGQGAGLEKMQISRQLKIYGKISTRSSNISNVKYKHKVLI